MHRMPKILFAVLVGGVAGGVVAAVSPACAQATQEQPATEETPTPDFSGMRDALRDVFDRVWAPRRRYADSPHMRSLFRDVIRDVARSIVQVRTGGRQVALGAVVGPDGWVLTKASPLKLDATPRCRLSDGSVHEARVVGIDRDYDLAMLKIDASRLPALDLTRAQSDDLLVSVRKPDETEEATTARLSTPQVGDWVATIGRGRDPIAVGVVSVAPRSVAARPGYLGVRLGRVQGGEKPGVLIEEALEGGGARDAGVRASDTILAVDGRPTNSIEELKEAVGDRSPGDAVDLDILRGDETIKLRAILAAWDLKPAERRALYQNRLGGELSRRRFGFPVALQHDTVLAPKDCGGPIVDVDGSLVGFNIARAGRTESYAIPAPVVASRMVDLMSGKLAPPPVPAVGD